jgi:hypothetical protein
VLRLLLKQLARLSARLESTQVDEVKNTYLRLASKDQNEPYPEVSAAFLLAAGITARAMEEPLGGDRLDELDRCHTEGK